ncbi:hypothetical protein BOTBODRAFT_144655 [Botryobasidium botryosum FD-172 SS1]|uniref:G-protein coupled receptors family 1 profile domain-containing protein n=1 Tax=Botryobasidium botryosum (strain FD-172 SS1) TaxID=930990 RepID=A0A067MXE1_BOTB1|nr:hypothetical protein BOTBODRAFT_144655 [Botryobasidium botryosum FD-172 SS1]
MPSSSESLYEVAPDRQPLGLASNIVSECLLAASVLSAGTVIILICVVQHNKSKLRARMVLGLFISHFWAGAILFGVNTASLAGHHPRDGTAICSVTAFMVAAGLWAQYFWTMALATVTYLILVHPMSVYTSALERSWLTVGLGVYVTAFGLAGLQLGLYPAIYIGGFCFAGDQGMIFNELMAFIPRCIVFLVVVVIYVRLHLFLRGSDTLLQSTDDMATHLATSRSKFVSRLVSARGFQHSASVASTNPRNPPDENDTAANPWEALDLGPDTLLNSAPTSDPWWMYGSSLQATPPSTDTTSSTRSRKPSTSLAPKSETSSISKDSEVDSHSGSTAVKTDASSEASQERQSAVRDTNPEAAPPGEPDRPPPPIKKTENVPAILHRKAALLFLLFPLTYTILTIVSLARLINDFTSSAPSPALHAISRWALFLQAPLDSLTYGLAGWKIKKDVRERTLTNVGHS